jgi:hypothetical protein
VRPVVVQLVKKRSPFVHQEGSLMSLPELATGHYNEPDESSTNVYPIYLRSILILSSHLCLGLRSVLFPSRIPTKILYVIFIYPVPLPPFYQCNDTCLRVQIMKLFLV